VYLGGITLAPSVLISAREPSAWLTRVHDEASWRETSEAGRDERARREGGD
jgi:hypothetical protein